MERTQLVEKLIGTWNEGFPDYPLKAQDLKEPQAVMGALFLIFARLGIDIEAVLAPPQEENCNKHLSYYWDLLPVINMTRVVNHLVSVTPQVPPSISITHFLQPTTTTSHSILLLLFNLMVFNEDRLKDIAPQEEELFAKTDMVKALEEKKNSLIEQLNQQAEEKGKRSERLEKLERDIIQFEEELEQEKELHEMEKQELEVLMAETQKNEKLLQQEKAVKETLMAEIARWKALRVYDVDDVNAQVAQAAQSVQEADEKLNSSRATLMEKESSLKNLQAIKPALDTANNQLHEIMKLTESLKECESGDLECEGLEGEALVVAGERDELSAAAEEARAARASATAAAQRAEAVRQDEARRLESALREAEEEDKISRERSKKALQSIKEIKQLTLKYKEEKAAGMEELANIVNTFNNELKQVEESLLHMTMEAEKKLRNKLKNCHNI